ncbi:MAG: type II toxin-antitoxin system RelE family toxin [Methanoregula sp.]|uniref:type II toxin-antitoxin system RelE family toxin n=1 Tax=Methanoregula sp. TaxID=2052170 RepID=UPI003FD7F291
MTFRVIPEPDVEASLKKLAKKDPVRFEQVAKKLRELADNPEMGKPLKNPLKGSRRLHIGHYVLIYTIDLKKQVIVLTDYARHDEVY